MGGLGGVTHLECDCGFVAVGDCEDAIVSSAKAHAWSAHRIELSGGLILALATNRQSALEEHDTE